MKTKLLYVLVSSENDIYLEQAYVSISSAKYHMPDVHITLLIDRLTELSLTPDRRNKLKAVSEIVVIDLPSGLTGQQRSRILKTSCRKYISGDFLFIDCDTIIVRPLYEIDNLPYVLAACKDAHSNFSSNPYRGMCINHCKKLGIDVADEELYFNSGVVLARDTAEVHKFYDRWSKNLKIGRLKGIFMDQPSFAKTNIELGHMISPLNDIWNCQIIHGIKYVKDANIIHYLCTSPTKKGDTQVFILRDKWRMEQIRHNDIIQKEIMDCFEDPFRGFPNCVHILSGNNIGICQSYTFRFLEKYNGSIVYKCLDNLFKLLYLAPNVFNRIISKLKND